MYNILSDDHCNKTEAPDPGEGPYQQFKYYEKPKRASQAEITVKGIYWKKPFFLQYIPSPLYQPGSFWLFNIESYGTGCQKNYQCPQFFVVTRVLSIITVR